jgi:hypothetical protein
LVTCRRRRRRRRRRNTHRYSTRSKDMMTMVMFRPYRDAAFSLKQLINKFSKMRAIKCSLHLYCVHRRLLKAMQHAQQLQRVSQ